MSCIHRKELTADKIRCENPEAIAYFHPGRETWEPTARMCGFCHFDPDDPRAAVLPPGRPAELTVGGKPTVIRGGYAAEVAARGRQPVGVQDKRPPRTVHLWTLAEYQAAAARAAICRGCAERTSGAETTPKRFKGSLWWHVGCKACGCTGANLGPLADGSAPPACIKGKWK